MTPLPQQTVENTLVYAKEVMDYLLSENKQYQKFATVEALFEDLEA